MKEQRVSIARELTRCRKHLQISQMRLARLMNLKTHRLADLEKARSQPTEAEEARVRRQIRLLLEQFDPSVGLPPSMRDPRLLGLMHEG